VAAGSLDLRTNYAQGRNYTRGARVHAELGGGERVKPRRSILATIAAAVLAASCSKPIDHGKLAAAAEKVRHKAGLAVARCYLKEPCDRIEYDAAFGQLEDLVLGDPRLKAVVEEYGIAVELALSNPGQNAERLHEASLRFENAVKEAR
jgi:hypothetical protein